MNHRSPRRHVADHRNGHRLDVDHARFVLGAGARGPMRVSDLPAFGSTADAW
ncbi:hypothetical protein J5J83_18800 [Azoarcus sp. L1K30]|uniref:hypothetical protein n=1 Tax=Azoarcus sp. L1K30 TaxID=2820277 RepID=UPI001B8454E3|nr:hypothetical protein [Azoarcus sp. L1K30]MBR0568174.1 hypothetical protein [Azoarcus sp. L1K30]